MAFIIDESLYAIFEVQLRRLKIRQSDFHVDTKRKETKKIYRFLQTKNMINDYRKCSLINIFFVFLITKRH